MTHHDRPGATAPFPKMTSTQPNDVLLETIRRRAYELFEQRGREDGHDFEDWITAELEVKRQTKAQAA
jgi:hypothetical protein